MGVISRVFGALFGGGANPIKDTVEVFRENAEAGAAREHALTTGALEQFAAEFDARNTSRFDRFVDGLNRLPRPALAFGTLGLFVSAMAAPEWFAARMAGMALIPEPMWWLLGAIVSFYFGARHQAKSQAFRKSLQQLASVAVQPRSVAPAADANPALEEWKRHDR